MRKIKFSYGIMCKYAIEKDFEVVGNIYENPELLEK